jgi:CubicO group peptidase (beta-lactamase class C family)
MSDVTISASNYNFDAVRRAMRRYIDNQILAGISHAVLRGRDLLELHCVGAADRENNIPLRIDHIFRAFSNTKLVTSCAILLLIEDGKLQLDDHVDRYIPQLGKRQVLKRGATSLEDTEPANTAITVRHLLSHSSGLSYGLLDPGTTIFKGYIERKVLNPTTPLSEMMDRLAELPLVFHPGTGWEYSVATDVLSHLVEVVSGEGFDQFLQTRIFDRLGMPDTGFVVPKDQQHRLTAYYKGADLLNPLKPGLTRIDDSPYPGAYRTTMPRLSGGGGLVSTLPDMITLMRSLLPGGATLLKADTIAQMMTNQVPEGVFVRFPGLGEIRGKGFGLAGAVTLQPSPLDPKNSVGELQWGGIAGTHWWISPRTGLAGLLMTQRYMAFWHPYSFEFKRLVHEAVA